MHDATFLFTDIEGSTRLWEEQPERMRPALARHDALAREVVEASRGRIVKMTGDGVHAVFEDALDAVAATVEMLRAVATAAPDIELRVRCGLHAGPSEGRDGDYFGTVVNRAARVMSAAHGGQALLSEAVVQRLDGRLPEGAQLRDLGAVRLRDLARPERIYQLVHAALREDFPALRSLEDTPNNLPLQLSTFVGREREIVRLRELIAAQRLVSIVGLGGLGKTRLALHAAAESLGTQPDGAWLVELAPVQDSRWVAQAIATTLGVKEDAGRPIEETLLRHVKDRKLLVVLDNCEHVLDGAAAIARKLLSAGPGVRLLVTSREALRIPGEALFPLGGLPVPGPRVVLSADAVASFESVRLFVDRAATAVPGFALDADNAAFIAAICHRLDGIPLAIELAAARVRSVSLAQIATRLKDRFRLLTSGDPTASPRQKTLRATIDWSHNLLPADEAALFRRLAIFAGGCTLEAAEAVCSGEDAEREAVLDLLSRLVEKSLATVDQDTGRYGMLETVREYAMQRLADAAELDRAADAHLAHFAALALEAKSRLAGPAPGEWLARLDAERENVLVALAWARRDARNAEAGLRIVDAIKHYWARRGLLELGHRLTEEALAAPGAAAHTGLRSAALFNLGQFRYFMGRYGEARESLVESVAIAREIGDTQVLGRALATLGMAGIGEGDLPFARRCLEESIPVAEANGDSRALFGAVNALAMLLRVEGDFRQSRPLYAQVLALACEAADRESEGVALLNLAMIAAEEGDLAGAVAHLRGALGIAAETGSAHAAQSGLEVCAGLAAMRGDDARAAILFGCAEAYAARTGAKRDAADERFLAPRMQLARERLGEAAFERAVKDGMAASPERALATARSWLGETAPQPA